jgi:hypothetical protein
MRTRSLLALCTLASMGCTAIIGVRDIYLDESSPNGSEADGGRRDGATSDGGRSDVDTSCNADLQTSPEHCGRCGHDCLGGACNAGTCEPVTLADGLMNPTSAVSNGASIVVTTYGDGRILEVPKTKGGAVRELRTQVKAPWGAAVDGSTLYWAESDFPLSGGAGSRGGIWKCTLPACANPTSVTSSDHPLNPVVRGGALYFAENNDSTIATVLVDGGARRTLDNTQNPWTVAIDDTHVYYTSSQPSLWRIPLAGGASQNAGPQGIYLAGGIALDGTRYYYTYTSGEQEAGAGHVVSFVKATPGGSKIEYGDDNIVPAGIAVDDAYVYWVQSGTWKEENVAVTNNDGQVRACPKAGCPASGPMILAKGLARPWEMSQDETALYVCMYGNFGQVGGSVVKIAKP